MKKYPLMVAAVGMALIGATAHATDYNFKVSCQDRIFVEMWRTGDIDPGKSYFLGQTHMRNPGCNVDDFNSATDGARPKVIHEGGEALVKSLPIIGWIFR
jgi:hypothetical protein